MNFAYLVTNYRMDIHFAFSIIFQIFDILEEISEEEKEKERKKAEEEKQLAEKLKAQGQFPKSKNLYILII